MKIFISSMIGGFQAERAAARSAVTALRHEAIMAEDFGARPTTPQIACLQEVRSADLVVLILGPRYGAVQGTSGMSPTHEEYAEARGKKEILVFVQEGVDREEQQAKFIAEVVTWQKGHFRAGFRTADELRDLVTRAVHDYQLANAARPLDVAALAGVARNLLPAPRRNNQAGPPRLHVGVAGGPLQRLLRPSELEAPDLLESIHREALFGGQRLFSRSKGVENGIEGSALVVEQEQGARVQLDERGSILLRLPLDRTERDRRSGFGMFAVIEEDVIRALTDAIQFAAWLLERIDSTQRITHVALVASIEASDYLGWRTQAEQDASPNSGTMRMAQGEDRPTSEADRPRAALTFQSAELAEDLMVPLRRQMKC